MNRCPSRRMISPNSSRQLPTKHFGLNLAANAIRFVPQGDSHGLAYATSRRFFPPADTASRLAYRIHRVGADICLAARRRIDCQSPKTLRRGAVVSWFCDGSIWVKRALQTVHAGGQVEDVL